MAHVATVYQVGLAVRVVEDEVRGGEADDDAPVAAAGGIGGGAVVEPADRDGVAADDLVFEVFGSAVHLKSGGKAQRFEGSELGLRVGGISEAGAEFVVFVVARDFSVVAGHHGAA